MLKEFWNASREVFNFGRSSDTRNPGGQHKVVYHPRTLAGVYITPDRALANDTVWAALRYISQNTAMLPKLIMKPGNEGGRSIVWNHYLEYLLNTRASEEWSAFQLFETLTGWAIMKGNGVAEIVRNAIGMTVGLYPLDPDRLEILRDTENGQLVYAYIKDSGERVDFAPGDVIHIRGYGNGPIGLSCIQVAAETIGWARATQLFGAAFFGNGAHYGGVISLKGVAKDDTIERVRDEFNSNLQGPYQSHNWHVIDGDSSVTQTSAKPNEAQYNETMQMQVEAICRIMGAPPSKVFHLLKMTYNNVEQMAIDSVGECIAPWGIRWGQELTYKLLGNNKQNLKVYCDVKDLMRGDSLTRSQVLQIQRRNGVISSDQWARQEGLPEPGKKNGGEIYIVEGNMTKAESVGEQPAGKGSTSSGDGGASTTDPQTPDPTGTEPSTNNIWALEEAERIMHRSLEKV